MTTTTGIEINGRQGVSVRSAATLPAGASPATAWRYPVEHWVACAACKWAYQDREPLLPLVSGEKATFTFMTPDMMEALDWVTRHQFYNPPHLRAWTALKKREEALRVVAG